MLKKKEPEEKIQVGDKMVELSGMKLAWSKLGTSATGIAFKAIVAD